MTIAVAIRTGSSVVFAADSKVTTRGIIGIEMDGSPRWLDQTYDNATKVVHDRDAVTMAMVAGDANIGQVAATDYLSTLQMGQFPSSSDQDGFLASVVQGMVEQKQGYWSTTQVPPSDWPGPTILLAGPSAGNGRPRVWNIDLEGAGSKVAEILQEPGIYLEGSYSDAFRLLYGWDPAVMRGVCQELNVAYDDAWKGYRASKVLRPLDKLNLWTMPVQDAMDLAYFLATLQVQMDRFLPGTPACGGPIDVMVLRMAPTAGIQAFPGKALHHPGAPG